MSYTPETTQRHINILLAIDAGCVLREQMMRRLNLTETEVRISLARLQKLALIEVEDGVFSNRARKRYSLLVPVERAIEAVRPPKVQEWSDALSSAWRMPVAIPSGRVAYTHVVGW
jgi:transcription initiation factor IIE alpha subunit